MNAPILTWIVRGARRLPDGSTQTMLATAFGGTERVARKSFHFQQEILSRIPEREGVPIYTDDELAFVAVEEGALE